MQTVAPTTNASASTGTSTATITSTNGNGRVGNGFNWTQDQWKAMNNLVWQSAEDMRVIRPLLHLCGPQGAYVNSVEGHQVKFDRGLSVAINQSLTPVKISCDVRIHQEQFNDDGVAHKLAVEATYRVVAAEEAVILLGHRAEPFLKEVGVTATNLKEQVGLFHDEPQPIACTTTVLDSIIAGIRQLQQNGRFRNYAVIVSLDLYQQAMKDRQNPFDAQIHEIRPLLVEHGFLYSQAIPEQTGVIFSLSGNGIEIAVPVSACLEFVEEKKDAFLEVVEQFRLLIDVPEAVVPLQ